MKPRGPPASVTIFAAVYVGPSAPSAVLHLSQEKALTVAVAAKASRRPEGPKSGMVFCGSII